jgi:hypothetical protein
MKLFLYLFFVIIIFCEIFAVLFPLYWFKENETSTYYVLILYVWNSLLKILFTIGMILVLYSSVNILQSILRPGRYLLLMIGTYSFLPDLLNLFTLIFPNISLYCSIINSVIYVVLLILGIFLFFSKEYFYGIFFHLYAIHSVVTVYFSVVIINFYLGIAVLCLLNLLLLFFLWCMWIYDNKRNDILNCFGYIITSVMLIGVLIGSMIPQFLL